MSSSTEVRQTLRDRVARVLDSGLPVLGVAIVMSAVMWGGGGWGPIWMAVTGLLLVEAGVWRLGSRVMHERRYMPLRREVQRFTGLARDLHHATAAVRAEDTPASREVREAALAAMRSSLDRIVAVAGKTEEDLQAEGAPATATARAVALEGAEGR
ncbi:MAG TPA: hypothetical protein VMM12_03825 [Longimicrobiales bacterium]|nr:hypothetical protein [Longimicrobiales bacterium]